MACTVERNEDNQITRVLNQDGNESQLFIRIAGHPLINTTEDALNIYKNIYSKKLSEVPEAGISFTHSVNDTQYNSFKEALQATIEGQELQIGFEVAGEFTPIITTVKTTDLSSVEGFTQAGVVEGIIAEDRAKIGNEYLLQSAGESEMRKNASLDLLSNSAMTNLGSRGIEVSGTTFRLNKDIGKTFVELTNGEIIKVDSQELDELSIDELKAKYTDYDWIFAEREYRKNVPLYRENDLPITAPILKSEEEIKIDTLKLLKNMGVSVVSMTNYTEKYEVRNSAPISAQALADIANNVIAFQVGQDTLENLREETIHFIIEALPQARLENVLRNIDKSEEYKQFAQTYREVYSKEYDSADTEMAVRKEVLGKIALNAVQQQATDATSQNFFESALRFIQEFFQDIASYFKPKNINDLSSILSDIQDILDSGDISGLELDNLEDNRFRFYSLEDKNSNASKIVAETRKQIDILNRENNDLERNQEGSKLNRAKLIAVQKQLDDKLEIHAVATVVRIVDQQTNRLNAAIKDSEDKKKPYDLSQEEVLIFKNLIGETTDTLGTIKSLIENDETLNKLNTWKTLSSSITDTQNKITALKARRSTSETQAFERLVDSVTIDRGLSQREKETMMRWSIAAENDISWLGSTFGTLNNSPDALMSLFATVKTGMLSEGSRLNHNQLKAYQKAIYDNGYDEKVIATFAKNGYFLSERDLPAYFKKLDDNFLAEYKKVFTDNTLKDEEILAKRTKGTLDWTDEKKDAINEATRILNENESERRMASDYYKELEDKYTNLEISKDTQKILQSLNADKRKITERARDKNGKIDLSLLSGQDRKQLLTLNLERKQMKSYIDETGTLKEGLAYSTDEEGKVVVRASVPLEQLSPASRLSLDINKLDNSFEKISDEGKQEIPQSFIDTILAKEDRESQLQALELNAQIGFSSDFWESLGTNTGLLDRISDEDLISDIRQNIFKRNNILRLYSKTLNPTETDVENMPELSKQTIKDIEETLSELYAEARESLPESQEQEESLVQGISGVNEAWNKRIQDLGFVTITDILKEAKLNMTDKNRKTVQQAEDSIESYIGGFRETLPKSVNRALDARNLDKEDLLDIDVRTEFLKTYAEDRLLSYYRRYTPQTYNEFQSDLNSDKPIAEILQNLQNNIYEFIEIRPNYSFQDEDISKVNPKYIVNSGMGTQQPSADKYMNSEFYNLFGKVTRDTDGNYLSSEKNEKLFNVYKATMKFRRDQIALMDGDASYNIYMSPQIRKQGIERYLGGLKSLSGQSIKDAFENLKTYTEDDQIQGDNRLGSANKSIPKPFYNRLESQTDLTEDIFHGLAMTNAGANLYKARVKYFGDAMAIIDKASTITTPNGKVGTATNIYKALDSAMDNDMFGIKQSSTASITVPFVGKLDGGKVISNLGAFARFKGLGGSVIIPSVAYLSAKSTQTVERIVGQYINKDSYKRGSSIYHKEVGAAMSEINHVRTTSKLNALGQFWGAFDIDNTLGGSKFSAFPRLLSKSAMLLYTSANYPLYGKGMLTVLNDFRIVEGRVVKFTDFQRNERTKNLKITNAEIREKWSAINTVMYDFLEVSDSGEVVFNKEKLQELLKDNEGSPYTEETLNKEIERFSSDIRVQIKNLNVRVDNQLSHEDRVAAQRHWLLQFLMTFKSFMIVLAENRFKGYSFNTQSRQVEEGSYSGIYRMTNDILNEWRKNGNGFIEAFKNQYNGNFTAQENRISELENIQNRDSEQERELQDLKEEVVKGIENSELRKTNMKRLGADLLFCNTIMLISLLLRGFADEDKDRSNWSLQMANLLTYRLVGEMHSANTGIANQYYQTLKEPLQAFDMILSLDSVFKESSYQDGKTLGTLGKVLPLSNSLNQLLDPGTAYENKVFYQEHKDNMFFSSPMYQFLHKDEVE